MALPWFTEAGCRIFVDAAIRPHSKCGLAAIVRDERGAVVQWLGVVHQARTNNEAEYAAAIYALRHLRLDHHRPLTLYSDSLLLIQHLRGIATARAPELQRQLAELRQVMRQFHAVSFEHIPREHNRLADALANEVADGEVAEGVFYGR